MDDLLEAAREASRSAYCPYSKFRVGAAVRAGGRVFTGANVENASYGLTVCAERTAAYAAVLAGAGPIEAVAVACVDAPEGADPAELMPCGACRQVLAEFAGPETPVAIDRAGTFRLAELLPRAFRLRGPTPDGGTGSARCGPSSAVAQPSGLPGSRADPRDRAGHGK